MYQTSGNLGRPKLEEFVLDYIYNWRKPLSPLYACDSADDLLDFCSSTATLSSHQSFSEGREPLASCSFRCWRTWNLTTTADPTTATVNADLREMRGLIWYGLALSKCQCTTSLVQDLQKASLQVFAYVWRPCHFSFLHTYTTALQLHIHLHGWSDWLTARLTVRHRDSSYTH